MESALLSRLIGNGSYQAKGAGAQPRSLDSSPTHGCPTLGRQRTSGLWCNSNQVSSPPVGGGRAIVTWGPASQLPYPDPVSLANCLMSAPSLYPSLPSSPPSVQFSSSVFIPSFFLSFCPAQSLSLSSFLYGSPSIFMWSLSHQPLHYFCSVSGSPLPHAWHILASTPTSVPIPGASYCCLRCPGPREWVWTKVTGLGADRGGEGIP